MSQNYHVLRGVIQLQWLFEVKVVQGKGGVHVFVYSDELTFVESVLNLC